jgi:hypothetical protein
MTLSEAKTALPLLLARHALKLSALVIQKLVLVEDKDDEEINVKHYDLQCEGVEILIGFFKSKQQATLLKAFTNIRHRPSSPKSAPPTQKANGTTRLQPDQRCKLPYSPFRKRRHQQGIVSRISNQQKCRPPKTTEQSKTRKQ